MHEEVQELSLYEEDWVTWDDANNIHKGDKLYFCLDFVYSDNAKEPYKNIDGTVVTVISSSRELGIQIEEDGGKVHFNHRCFHRLVEEPTEVDEYDFNTVYA